MEDCIEHTQKGDRRGYGTAWYQGLCRGMHRVVYAKHHGLSMKALDGVVVMHTCDNPRCINPQHLLLGTMKDNTQDMLLRDRARRGDLTMAQVVEIRSRHVTRCPVNGGGALAKEYGVAPSTISLVVNNKYRPR